jgi:predicted DNA-binding helix-hairpin-helix protein
MNSGDKLHINVCSFDDLLGLSSVGKATAYKIWELRKSTEITPEVLATISHLKMEKALPLIDFSPHKKLQKVGTSKKARRKVRKDLMKI